MRVWIFLCLWPMASLADMRCREVPWSPDHITSLKVGTQVRLHAELPEPILDNRVITGAAQSWDATATGPHLFLRAKVTNLKEGARTSVTVFGESGIPYHFAAVRELKHPDRCVRLITSDNVAVPSLMLPTAPVTDLDTSTALVDLNERLQHSEAQRRTDILNALNAYRGHVYTRYTVRGGGRGLKKSDVSDVWDDGRFTYVRVKQRARALLQVSAVLDGEDVLIDYTFNHGLYQIAGLYPELSMRLRNARVRIVRSDDDTLGAY